MHILKIMYSSYRRMLVGTRLQQQRISRKSERLLMMLCVQSKPITRNSRTCFQRIMPAQIWISEFSVMSLTSLPIWIWERQKVTEISSAELTNTVSLSLLKRRQRRWRILYAVKHCKYTGIYFETLFKLSCI